MTDKMVFTCRYCGAKITSVAAMVAHVKALHEGRGG